jgi:p-cumate 2,3-dioxygenase alpha subunit
MLTGYQSRRAFAFVEVWSGATILRATSQKDRTMDLSRLVVDDFERGTFRVHRSVMTSPEILQLERERIFGRTWLYVGHESEVLKPGDFCRRVVAGRPLFMIRGRDNRVRIFINSCLHRGALICRQDSGNSANFVCFYHGWAYDDSGKLISVPDPDGYAEDFKTSGRILLQPAQVGSYRGLYFVNFWKASASLQEFLGEACELIDLSMDSAELLGGWQVVRGAAKYDIHANWKLLLENSSENYHFHTTHKTFSDYAADQRKKAGLERSKINNIENSRGLAFPNGHVAMVTRAEGRTIASPSPLWSEEAIAATNRMRDGLANRFGPERGYRMADYSRFLMVFPNLAIHDTQSGFKLRQWWPTAPDSMEVTQWELAPRHEREDLLRYRLDGALMFQGPGGFGTPDDIEALESCQTGYGATEVEWSDLSRGMRREARSDDELTARGFWRQWHALIQGRPGPIRVNDLPPTQAHTRAQAAR